MVCRSRTEAWYVSSFAICSQQPRFLNTYMVSPSAQKPVELLQKYLQMTGKGSRLVESIARTPLVTTPPKVR